MEWREIPGFPSYEISNTGIVKRVGIVFSGPGRVLPFPKVIKPHHCAKHQRPQEVVDIHDAAGKRKTRSVSQLVALTFFGPPPSSRYCVIHKDRNRDNHAVGNLRWGTRDELRITYPGSHRIRRLLPEDDYVAFRYLQVDGKLFQLAMEIGPLGRLEVRGRRFKRDGIISDYKPLSEVIPGAVRRSSSPAAASLEADRARL